MFLLLVSFVPYPISEFFVFVHLLRSSIFFVALISRVAFFLLCSRTRWFAYLDSLADISRMKNQDGHWGYC